MKTFVKNSIQNFARLVSVLRGSFVSRITRPIKTDSVVTAPRPVSASGKVAVLIQGPLKLEEDFTLETVRLYKKTLLPTTEIIVTTWEGENAETLQKIRELGARVVTDTLPANRGILNVNLQITSVVNGIRRAEELGAEYILKTRTDTRMYATNIEEYLCGLLKSFPAAANYKQKYRILGLSLNSNLYRMYNISDLVIFGHAEDMTTYWDVPLDDRTKEPPGATESLRKWSEARMVETYLTAGYLERIGRTLHWTVEDSFRAFAEHFIIIDEQSIDLFWYKYNYWKEYRNRNYHINKNDVLITFRDWLSLYAGIDHIKVFPEHATEIPFKEPIT